MSVAVVIPAYNAEHHLERAVASVLDQTARPTEVLLVDDGSTDGTLDVMRRLSTQHAEIRVITLTKNAGPAHARNVGIAAASSDWIAIHDADDTLSPGRYEAMVAAGESSRADVVVDNFVFVNERDGSRRPSRIAAGQGMEQLDRYRFFREARAFNHTPTWTLLQPLIRRTFLDQHHVRYPEDSRHGEDFQFMAELLLCGARCVRVRNPGYLYTERQGGLSTTRTDYTGLVRQTQRLLQDHRVRADRRARRLLQRRLATLRCLAAERSGLPALLMVSIRPGVAATLARRAGRRASRALRPRPPEQLPDLL